MTLASIDVLAARSFEDVAQEYGLKAAGLSLMSGLGLPVPKAFASPVGDETFDEDEWAVHLAQLNGPYSVRSGGRTSMPGLMRTFLNVGLDDDAARRLVRRGMDVSFVDGMRAGFTDELGVDQTGVPTIEIVKRAFRAVQASKPSGKAVAYRRILAGDPGGTGVVVQEMRFGNLNADSGSGVIFSHDPVTGEEKPVVDYAAERQGTAAVEGAVDVGGLRDLRIAFPKLTDDLLGAVAALATEYGTPVDVEFTIEDGHLFLLQCRRAVIAQRHEPRGDVDLSSALAVGVPASTGAAVGRLVHANDVTSDMIRGRPGELVLLAETADLGIVSDVPFLAAVVVINGGPLCHLALVARSSRVPCLVGLNADGADILRGRIGSFVLVDAADAAVHDARVGPSPICPHECLSRSRRARPQQSRTEGGPTDEEDLDK